MRGSTLLSVGVALLGALAGATIAGRPESAAGRIIPASTTSTVVSTTTVALPETTATATTTVTQPAGIHKTAAVVLANAAGSDGLAARVAATLATKGWTALTPATAKAPATTSRILAAPGFEATAQQLAIDLGLTITVEPLGTESLTTDDSPADIVVLLGTDVEG